MKWRKTWRIGILITAILLTGIVVFLVYCNVSVRSFNTYVQDLESIMDTMVLLNAPIADIFATGEELEVAVMETVRLRIGQLMHNLETPGRPPAKLVGSYATLEQAINSFDAAYDMLATALEAGSTSPFNTRFLETAHGAGLAIHQAYATLPSNQPQSCRGF